MACPTCTILSGPNGSGKSSIYEALSPAGLFINADMLARQLNPRHPEAASVAAGREVLRSLGEAMRMRADFVFETTLSGRQPLELMRRARAAGYAIGLIFVLLQSVDLHVDRIAQRVMRGGHHIPEAIVRRRYESAMVRLATALRLADEALILDNTYRQPMLLARIDAGSVVETRLDPVKPAHARMANVLAQAFGLDERTTFDPSKVRAS